MKIRIIILFLIALSACSVNSCSTDVKISLIERGIRSDVRSEILFDDDWRFFRGDTLKAEETGFDDSYWRLLDLPHDWSIEDIPGTDSPFDSNAIGGIDAGYLTGGTGWYRKTFDIPSDLRGKHCLLRFDGIYMNADIWLNGNLLCSHPYGYTSFRNDITELLIPGSENLLAVKVSNEGRNSRWYSGSGIYRHVWFEIFDPVHLDPWETAIITPLADTNSATINIRSRVFNQSSEPVEAFLITSIIDQNGSVLLQDETRQEIKANESTEFINVIVLSKPEMWSVESPVMYCALNKIYTASENGRILRDSISIPFGIRRIDISEGEGFRLNGKPMLLKGGCMHHDNGPLGSAAFDRAEERRVELMKESGYNAIRCAHNPPSPAFLDACDRLGILVIDEAFDMWRVQKNPDDYHLYFNDWWKKDISSMVLRDRNHPSVIFWSIGNEIPERGHPEGAEIARQMAAYVKQIDSSRLITSAVNSVGPDKDPYFATLDVCGYNYAVDNYVSDHKRLPGRIIVSTESFPLEAFEYWMAVKDNHWVIGDFVWTGYDYLGEASIGWLGYPHEGSFFPWTHAYCGDIDICGFKRPQSFYRDILWENGQQVSIFVRPPVPSFPVNPKKEKWSKWEWQDVVARWNWDGYEGKDMDIEVYSTCPEVELFLNEISLGRKENNRRNKWITTWRAPYKPGTLSAKGYEGISAVATCDLKTAGDPEKIVLTADRSAIKANGQDLSFITVELLDTNGIRNPTAENLIHFEIEGPGSIIAVGSSRPMGTESFKRDDRKAWQGRCLAIVRAGKDQGIIKLKATADGLSSAETEISTYTENGQ